MGEQMKNPRGVLLLSLPLGPRVARGRGYRPRGPSTRAGRAYGPERGVILLRSDDAFIEDPW
jgi:hypothetical protein